MAAKVLDSWALIALLKNAELFTGDPEFRQLEAEIKIHRL